jgi:hypothetical protein
MIKNTVFQIEVIRERFNNDPPILLPLLINEHIKYEAAVRINMESAVEALKNNDYEEVYDLLHVTVHKLGYLSFSTSFIDILKEIKRHNCHEVTLERLESIKSELLIGLDDCKAFLECEQSKLNT